MTAALSNGPYRGEEVTARLDALLNSGSSQRFVAVDDERILQQVGSRKALNTVLLACALAADRLPLTLDDLRRAIRACVKPQFVDMNLQAIDAAVRKTA